MRDLESLKFVLAQGIARRDDAHKRFVEKTAEAAELASKAVVTKKSLILLQEVAAQVQEQLEEAIASNVQGCLDLLFPGYTFRVNFVPRRGKTEVDFHICKGKVELNPLASSGGGVVDAISFALRAGCLHLAGKRQALILDEPFKHVRGTPRKELGRALEQLSETLGVQVLMVGDVAGTDINADQEYSF